MSIHRLMDKQNLRRVTREKLLGIKRNELECTQRAWMNLIDIRVSPEAKQGGVPTGRFYFDKVILKRQKGIYSQRPQRVGSASQQEQGCLGRGLGNFLYYIQ